MIPVPGSRLLWAFDFDGTISRIVPDRNDASMVPECRDMLRGLVGNPWNRVAVISSRTLEDVAPRVPVPGLYVGGGSGLEWKLPDGSHTRPGGAAEKLLAECRRAIGPLLSEIAAIPGVEVEDKFWSVAIHIRDAPRQEVRSGIPLKVLLRRSGIRVYRGPDVLEVQLVPRSGKSPGLRRLCRLAGLDPRRDGIVYAGDDESDAAAMRWVLRKGGTALCVGGRIRVPGACAVSGPEGLPPAIRRLARSASRRAHKPQKCGTA